MKIKISTTDEYQASPNPKYKLTKRNSKSNLPLTHTQSSLTHSLINTSLSVSVAATCAMSLPAARLSLIDTRTLSVVMVGALRLRTTVMGTVAVLLLAGDPPSTASTRS